MKLLNVCDLSEDRVKCLEQTEPSVTQPDEALTIQQILARVQAGLTTGVGASVREDDYDDPSDDDFDDPTLQPGFDKLDALQISTSEESDDLREKVDKAKKRKKKKEQEDAFEAEVQRRIAEKEKQQVPPQEPNS